MATERKALKTYTGDGSQKIFAFPFDYLNTTYVKVIVSGVELAFGTDYTVVNKQVELVAAPALDAYVVIRRQTPTTRLVVWADASVLREKDLTLFELQLLHISEETYDAVQESGMALDETDGKWDARLKNIKNIGIDGLDLADFPAQVLLAKGHADRAEVAADKAEAAADLIGTIPVPVPAHAGEGIVVNEAGDGLTFGSSGSGNVVLLGHSNASLSTAAGTEQALLNMWFLQDDNRNKRRLKVTILEKGSGIPRIAVSDGTVTVQVTGTNKEAADWAITELKVDTTTLDASKVWALTLYGTSVTGTYQVRRFNLTAGPASQLVGNSLILWHPNAPSNYAALTLVGTKWFPINFAIDASCVVRTIAALTLNSGTTATMRVKLSTSRDGEVSEIIQDVTVTASGRTEMLIPFPSIVAPYVRVDVYLSTDGMVTLEHFECWLEV